LPGQFVEFQSKGLAGQAIWKGALYDESAAFLDTSSQDLMFCRKGELFVKDDGENSSSKKKLKATITVGERTCDCTISPQSLKTFEAWKGGTALPSTVQQSMAQDRISVSPRDARGARMFSRIMLFVVLALVLYFVIAYSIKR
jgi:hypothetical protein